VTGSLDALLVLIVLTNLRLLGSSRLGGCIRVVAAQGILLGGLPLLAGEGVPAARSLLLSAAGVGLKGIVFPWLLSRALREARVQREVQPFLGYTASILLGGAILGIALWGGARLPLPPTVRSTLLVPVALATMLTGLLVVVSRSKAITQVLGYLVFENGIYAFGVGIAPDAPLLVELGILLDVFVAVFVMGITIFHISREFDDVDTDRLSALRDWRPSPSTRPGGGAAGPAATP
jgi:hydrogenase-4 component E